jgi:hypothetical protein
MLSVYDLPLDTFPDSAFMGFEKTLTYLEVISTQFTSVISVIFSDVIVT